MIKHYMILHIPYWRHKKLSLDLYKRFSSKERYQINLIVFKLHRLHDCPGYEKEWGTNDWKIITLFEKNKKKNAPRL